ncbi:MAG: hypothetical protein JW751_29010 [Polyangiaceae bacterium]|nr:hypothetical protein [Polyangiaceae bacterium]
MLNHYRRPSRSALARGLADAVLADDLLRRAAEVRRLVEERSPFALVRAVELAAGLAARSAKPVGCSPTSYRPG